MLCLCHSDPNLASLKQSHRPATRDINANPFNVWPDNRNRGFRSVSSDLVILRVLLGALVVVGGF